MAQLPGTRNTQDDQLNDSPPDNLCIRRLRLITKLGFSFLYSISTDILTVKSHDAVETEHEDSPSERSVLS